MDDTMSPCPNCRSQADCRCLAGQAKCRVGACDCPLECPCRKPRTCLPELLGPIILWPLWIIVAILMLVANDTPVWLWIVWLLPIIWILLPIATPTGPGAVGPDAAQPPAPPWYVRFQYWPTLVVLLLTIIVCAIVLLASGGDDGDSIVSDTATTEARDDATPTSEERAEETTTTEATLPPEDPDEIVASTAPPTTDPAVVAPPSTDAPASTTTTEPAPPTTVSVALPPDTQAIVDEFCAVDGAGGALTEDNFVDGDAEIVGGPAEGSSPPPAADPPPGIEIEYVGVATGTCPRRQVLVSVRVVESVVDLQVSLALDFPDDVAGDGGFASDPNATDPIGMTDGWDQLFPFDGGELLQFDDRFMTIDTGAEVRAEGNLVTYTVPVGDDVEMVGYTIQTFFRDGTTAEDPIAWNAASGTIDLAPPSGS